MNNIKLSYIIPSYNEELNIGNSIESIKCFTPLEYEFQIIVVDNGSSDDTVKIVKEKCALLYENLNGTISLSRNIGVQKSDGNILIFLDSDVLLTEEWNVAISQVINDLLNNKMQITGSRCSVIDNNNWILKYWFSRLRYEKSSYINSGHLITTRELFNSIGGFTTTLKTGEDYDFCKKAKNIGATIKNNSNLTVIHTGYPLNVSNFISRERWHGSQDYIDLNSIFKSKQALIAILHFCLLLCSISATIFSKWFLFLYLFFMCILSIALTIIKFGSSPPLYIFVTALIYYFYIIGRTWAFIDKIKDLFKSKQLPAESRSV